MLSVTGSFPRGQQPPLHIYRLNLLLSSRKLIKIETKRKKKDNKLAQRGTQNSRAHSNTRLGSILKSTAGRAVGQQRRVFVMQNHPSGISATLFKSQSK